MKKQLVTLGLTLFCSGLFGLNQPITCNNATYIESTQAFPATTALLCQTYGTAEEIPAASCCTPGPDSKAIFVYTADNNRCPEHWLLSKRCHVINPGQCPYTDFGSRKKQINTLNNMRSFCANFTHSFN